MFAIAGFVALIPAGPMALIAAACCLSCAGSMDAMRSAPSRSAEEFTPLRLKFDPAPSLRPPAAPTQLPPALDDFFGGGSDGSFALATSLATSSGLPAMSPSILRRSSLSAPRSFLSDTPETVRQPRRSGTERLEISRGS